MAKAETEIKFKDVALGDRVWLESRGLGGRTNRRIATIKRATPKMLYIGGEQYLRSSGGARSHWVSTRIDSVATPKECASYDSEQEEIKQRQLRELAEDEKRKGFIKSLRGLFKNANVSETEFGEDRDSYYDVLFTRLTEKEVRALARNLGKGTLA